MDKNLEMGRDWREAHVFARTRWDFPRKVLSLGKFWKNLGKMELDRTKQCQTGNFLEALEMTKYSILFSNYFIISNIITHYSINYN